MNALTVALPDELIDAIAERVLERLTTPRRRPKTAGCAELTPSPATSAQRGAGSTRSQARAASRSSATAPALSPGATSLTGGLRPGAASDRDPDPTDFAAGRAKTRARPRLRAARAVPRSTDSSFGPRAGPGVSASDAARRGRSVGFLSPAGARTFDTTHKTRRNGMTAATKTKTSPLARLEQLEAEQARAAAEHSELSREQARVFARARELSDQRRRETHRDPTLVDAHGSPVDSGGVIAAIDKELESLGDLHDLAARVTHAREVERKRQGDVRAFIDEHAEELLEELVPVGEEHVAAVAERVSGAGRGSRALPRVHTAHNRPDSRRSATRPSFDQPRRPTRWRTCSARSKAGGAHCPTPRRMHDERGGQEHRSRPVRRHDGHRANRAEGGAGLEPPEAALDAEQAELARRYSTVRTEDVQRVRGEIGAELPRR